MNNTGFKALKRLGSMHFGLKTSKPASDTELWQQDSPAIFNPHNDGVGFSFVPWFKKFYRMNTRGSRFTVKYWDGFAMYPSLVTPYCLSDPTCRWYYMFGQRDVFDEWLFYCNVFDQAKVVYFNMYDGYWTANSPGPTLQEWNTSLLEEIAARVAARGGAQVVFIDAWGRVGGGWDGTGVTYSQVDRVTMLATVHTLFPGALIIINDHIAPTSNGSDIRGWERTAGEVTSEPTAGITDYPVMLDDTLHTPYHEGLIDELPLWFNHHRFAGATTDDVAHGLAALGRRYRMLNMGYPWMGNASLAGDGSFPSATEDMLDELIFRDDGPVIVEDLFPIGSFDTVPGALDGGKYTRVFGSDSPVINPSGELWVNNAGSAIVERTTSDDDSDVFRDGAQKLRIKFKTVPATLGPIGPMIRCNDDGTNHDRMQFAINSGNWEALVLVVFANSGSVVGTNISGPTSDIEANVVYEFIIRKNADHEIRAEFCKEVDGEMIPVGAINAVDNSNDVAGHSGFIYQGAATATTGAHITRFRSERLDTTVPLPPTLSLLGDETNGHYIGVRRFGNAIRTELFRSDNNGLTWKTVGYGTAGQFIDEDRVVGETYRYRAVSLNSNYVESAVYSNVVTLTVTESDVLIAAQSVDSKLNDNFEAFVSENPNSKTIQDLTTPKNVNVGVDD